MQMVLVDPCDRTYIYWQLYSKSEKVGLDQENFFWGWVGNVRTSNIPSKACHNKAINVGENSVSGKNKGGWCQGGENRWRHMSSLKPGCITGLGVCTVCIIQ